MRRLSGMSCAIIMRIIWVRLRSIRLLGMVVMKMSITLELRRVVRMAMGADRSTERDILIGSRRRMVGFRKGMKMLPVPMTAVQGIAWLIQKSNNLKKPPSRHLDAVVTALMMGIYSGTALPLHYRLYHRPGPKPQPGLFTMSPRCSSSAMVWSSSGTSQNDRRKICWQI
jgi:hypothetical protein